MKNRNRKSRLFCCTVCTAIAVLFMLLSAAPSRGQSVWKNWNSLQGKLSLTKKLDIELGHLRSFNITDSYRNDFAQTAIQADYELNRRWSLRTGMIITAYPSSGRSTTRFLLRGGYTHSLGRNFRWTNSLQGERHSASEKRFAERLVFTTRLGLRKRWSFLRLAPSATYSLFYNFGGSSIQYFDASGNPVVDQPADGLHRSRLSFHLNSKINKYLSCTLYTMIQREFNTGNEYQKINVWNPVSGKIIRPFDDYQVIGLSLNLDFNAYSQHQN